MNLTGDIQMDTLADWKRTHDCGSLRAADIGQEALLMGWVNSRRDLGNLIFIDLRDREGITQIVFDPNVDEEQVTQKPMFFVTSGSWHSRERFRPGLKVRKT